MELNVVMTQMCVFQLPVMCVCVRVRVSKPSHICISQCKEPTVQDFTQSCYFFALWGRLSAESEVLKDVFGASRHSRPRLNSFLPLLISCVKLSPSFSLKLICQPSPESLWEISVTCHTHSSVGAFSLLHYYHCVFVSQNPLFLMQKKH